MRVLLADSRLGQGADKTADRTAGGGDERRRGQPTGRDDRPDTGDGEEPETGEQTGNAADSRADSGAGRGAFGPVIDAVEIAVDFARGARRGAVAVVPTVGVVRDDADIAVRNSRPLQLGDGTGRGIVVIVQT